MAIRLHFKLIRKDANSMLLSLILFEILLVLIYSMDNFLPVPQTLFRLFDFHGESTIPSWFSSSQLSAIGILFFLSGNWTLRNKIRNRGFLFVVGLGFIFLSMDETALIHEKLSRALRHLDWVQALGGNVRLWTLIYSVIAVVLAAFGSRTIISMWKAYPRQSLLICIGLIVYLIGAAGLNLINFGNGPVVEGTQHSRLDVTLEEFFQMLGTSIVLYGVASCFLKPTSLQE